MNETELKQAEIEQRLSKCSSLAELIKESNECKKAGYPDTLVNRVMMDMRKKLAASSNSIKPISKIPASYTAKEKISTLAFGVNKLSGSTVVIQDGQIML